MGLLSIVNHFGTFLLLVATILLIVASITAPTVDRISFLTVDLGAAGEITFGSFGWCLRGSDNDQCSSAKVGYNPAEVISRFQGAGYSTYREDTAEALTNVMILHPIAAGVCFIAFILSIGTSFFGSLMSSLVAGSAFLITLVALICDWVWMALIANNVNDAGDDAHDRGARAQYDAALWCALAAAICALIASVILFFTCCAGRRNRSRAERSKADFHSPPATTTHRRRWWSRNRY